MARLEIMYDALKLEIKYKHCIVAYKIRLELYQNCHFGVIYREIIRNRRDVTHTISCMENVMQRVKRSGKHRSVRVIIASLLWFAR